MLNIENGVLIMDNASIHKTTEFTSACEEKGIVVKYLPAYSPFLNPIENLFSKWKSIVKSCLVQNEEELMIAINLASLEITSRDCNGYFQT
jgi:transposase